MLQAPGGESAAVPANFVPTDVLPATCVQTTLLPAIFVWTKLPPVTSVYQNVLRASGGETTVVLVPFAQTGDCRRPSCRRKGNGDLRVDERAAGNLGVVEWDACPRGRSESGASDFRADGRATGDHRADELLSTIFA